MDRHPVTKRFREIRGWGQTDWVEANAESGLAGRASKFGYLNLSSTRGEEDIVLERGPK